MFKLILKDFILLKRTIPYIGVWLALITISKLSHPSRLSSIYSLIPVFFAFVLVGNAIALDEKYKLENLFCSLPLKRSTIVYAKYLSTLFIILAGIILSFLAGLFFPEKIMTLKVSFFIVFFFFLFFSVLLPINYKFGLQLEGEPGKAALVLLFILVLIAVTAFLLSHFNINILKIKIIYLSLFLVMIVVSSLELSLVLYKKRDL